MSLYHHLKTSYNNALPLCRPATGRATGDSDQTRQQRRPCRKSILLQRIFTSMDTLMYSCLLTLLFSCSLFQHGKTVTTMTDKTEQFITIQLSETIWIHWDNRSHRIASDSLLGFIAMNFSEMQQTITKQILDTTGTPAIACNANRNLVVGDIAFLLVDEVKRIPYFQVLGVQFDAFNFECSYPHGLFTYISEDREMVKRKVEFYLASKE